jgi:hypothetical protein
MKNLLEMKEIVKEAQTLYELSDLELFFLNIFIASLPPMFPKEMTIKFLKTTAYLLEQQDE